MDGGEDEESDLRTVGAGREGVQAKIKTGNTDLRTVGYISTVKSSKTVKLPPAANLPMTLQAVISFVKSTPEAEQHTYHSQQYTYTTVSNTHTTISNSNTHTTVSGDAS